MNDAYVLCCGCAVPNVWISWTRDGSPHEVQSDNQLQFICAQVCQMSGVSHMKCVCDRPSYAKLTLRTIRLRSVSLSYLYKDMYNIQMMLMDLELVFQLGV